jgi:hypothetical protein
MLPECPLMFWAVFLCVVCLKTSNPSCYHKPSTKGFSSPFAESQDYYAANSTSLTEIPHV